MPLSIHISRSPSALSALVGTSLNKRLKTDSVTFGVLTASGRLFPAVGPAMAKAGATESADSRYRSKYWPSVFPSQFRTQFIGLGLL